MRRFIVLASFLFSILYLFSCISCKSADGKKETVYQHDQGTIFHTFYNAKYKSNEALTEAIEAVLDSVDRLANPFSEASLLYAVNNNLPHEASDELVYLFEKALAISEASGGHYDITVGPLVNIWGFGYEKSPYEGDVPSEVLDSLRQFVGMEKVTVEAGKLVKTDPRISVDMASIAKGYAADRVATMLRQRGCEDYMIEIGGEIAFQGVNPNGKNWTIGVNIPTLDREGYEQGNLDAILTLQGSGGVATSGNYRNYEVDEKGNVYAHIIDPIEGRPVQRDILSATILASDCATADALATAAMVLGSEKTLQLIESIDGVACYLLVSTKGTDYKRMISKGMEKYVKPVREL